MSLFFAYAKQAFFYVWEIGGIMAQINVSDLTFCYEGSLMTPAHLYIWDEPLNYIDVFSRMQIERLIETYQPTMLLVEHDVRFREKLATKIIEL